LSISVISMRSFSSRGSVVFRLPLAAVAVLAAVVAGCRQPARVEPTVAVTSPDGVTLTTVREPGLVYQKALWRRPGPGDTIRSAERREWSHASDGVRRWQWFLEFTPSAATRDWLATNPFSLAPVTQVVWPVGPSALPEWFPRDVSGMIIMQKNGGGFTFIQSKDGTHVFAMDEGSGFSAAAGEPAG
jgi:hypothetical protein